MLILVGKQKSRLQAAQKQKELLLLAADEIKQASQDLTRLCRAFVVTGGKKGISRENIDRLCRMRADYKVWGKHPGYKHYREDE